MARHRIRIRWRDQSTVYGFLPVTTLAFGAMIPDAVTQMKAAGKTYDIVTYEGAGHGFMRAGEAPDAKDADKKARAEALVRWKTLLAKYHPASVRVPPSVRRAHPPISVLRPVACTRSGD